MNDKDFALLYGEALASTDRDLYVAEWSTSVIFDPDKDGPEPDWEAVVQTLTDIWDVAHLDVREILQRAGLSQADITRRYGIPRRTVGNWCTGSRECPPWVRLMLAELTGVFKRP